MISTVGEAIVREGKASMHADGIDVRVKQFLDVGI